MLTFLQEPSGQGENTRWYDLHYVQRDSQGQVISSKKIGGDRWVPMTHPEACIVKSKFLPRAEYSIELVELSKGGE